MGKRMYRKKETSRRLWSRAVLPLVLALVVAGGGAALAFYKTTEVSTPEGTVLRIDHQKNDILPPRLDEVLPPTTVQDIATKAGGSPVADMSLENRSGVLLYVVTLGTGKKLGFSAVSGDAVTVENKDIDGTQQESQQKNPDQKETLPADFTLNTSFEDARKLAQVAFPNGKISQIHLSVDENIVALAVRFEDKAQVDINAANGSVIRITTPKGATAEAPDGTTSPSATPSSQDSSDADSSISDDASDLTNDEHTTDSPQTDSQPGGKASRKDVVRIEGVLTLANDIYTITDGGTTYIIESDEDLSDMVGESVRVEGKPQPGDTIQVVSIHLRNA